MVGYNEQEKCVQALPDYWVQIKLILPVYWLNSGK
jgi:hypothetical protein